MKLGNLFGKFDYFTNTPHAVAKMRVFILQLAVRGKLVAQNSADEPAEVLLERIRKMKFLLIEERAIKKQDTTPIYEEEVPFPVPSSWVWTRLGEIGDWGSGSTPLRGDQRLYGGGITWLKSGELNDNQALDRSEETLSDLALETGSFRKNQPGDILLAMYGATLGKTAILAKPAVTNQAVCGCTPFDGVLNRYLFNYLISQRTNFHLASEGGAQPNISKVKIVNTPFPLPPLAEQKRIVAKVEELMALCDLLEAQQKDRETRYTALARAAIAQFDEAPTTANLDSLFHTSYSLTPADLRKTIISLAVRGKLVPQDPNDETADESLARLGLTSAHCSSTKSDHEDQSIPSSWRRIRFDDIAIVTGGVTLGRKISNRKTVTLPYLRVANVKRGEIDLDIVKDVTIAEEEIERYALQKNDLLMTEGGDWDKVGRAAIWNGEISPCLHQNHVFRARMRSPEITPFWFERYFNSPQGRAYFESASKQTTNLASINMRQVRACPVPFPPLAEQSRILIKVDQLMKLVDQLETQLKASAETGVELLDAVVHELLRSTADAIEFPLTESDRTSQRAAIGCYAIEHLVRNPSFGRTMLMKVCYLSETHLDVPLGWKPMRQAAGPYDPEIETLELSGTRNGWFTVTEKSLSSGRSKYEYFVKHRLKAKAAEAISVLGERKAEFDRLLSLFAEKSTEEAEIIATLFAAWNDLLIDGMSPSGGDIIREVRENWHPQKERFSASLLQQWLDWMRRNRLIPKGCGPRTIQQLKLALK